MQVGDGVSVGCEAAVHAACRFLDSMNEDQIFVKLDFANAFNCLHRDHMRETIRNIFPEIYCFCFSAYRNHSILQFGNFSLMSRVGPQQGDPLASLLFCLAFEKLLRVTHSAFTSGFMDDIVNIRDVARDVDYIRTEGEAIVLFLNNENCEIISRSDTSNLTQAGTFYKFAILRPEDSTLLGTPLSRGSALDLCLEDKISKLRYAISRLRLLPAQEALIILRSSFSTPRLMHVLRCSPCFGHHLLPKHDTVLREGLSAIVNIHMSDIYWLQASISVKSGGLGIRRAVSLALPAFLASAVATSDLQFAILS